MSELSQTGFPLLQERFFLRHLGKGSRLLAVFLAVLGVPQLAGRLASCLSPFFSSIDPENTFAWISTHHVNQFLLTLGVMWLWSSASLKSWGFNLNAAKVSLQWFGWFAFYCTLGTLLFQIAPMVLFHHLPQPDFPLNVRNVTGYLGFQYLLSGTGEEPLFRGLVMVILLKSWTGELKLGKIVMPVAGLWATLLFMLAHVNYTLSPLKITHFSWQQQLFCLAFGLFDAAAFYRTRSLLCPVLAHGFSNGIIWTLIYLAIALNPIQSANGSTFGEVKFDSNPPLQGEMLVVTYRASQGPLADAKQVSLHWGINMWQDARTTPMAAADSGAWQLTLKVPSNAEQLDFAFTDGSRWDNNRTRDWHVLTRKPPTQ